jgi:cellulose synthase/poly-beta-1,6-N-acetylglucosamine synthase-like glycosyltransferase
MISVIIPTYKEPEALDLCLKSALEGQRLNNQIIVVVDGFYDINKEVLDKYEDSIEILVLEENVGLPKNEPSVENVAPCSINSSVNAEILILLVFISYLVDYGIQSNKKPAEAGLFILLEVFQVVWDTSFLYL